ncbi:hypothetical protein [Mucilaginibacter rubeus]|uniref:Uncharacterized protein n=1 Tax=Mucilaginibacter rubeus TaxID=2027860 RepID=A0A5C1I492_9SPHI|nr:hypothetical protein [Mucilaginibacter rubeus]QEM12130.1 hypothetical protein DEO27_019565 [Mucilaginibacter rubeus]
MLLAKRLSLLLIILSLVFPGTVRCQVQDSLKKLAGKYIQAKLDSATTIELQEKLFNAGKSAVPFLIDKIDWNEKLVFGEKDDFQSSFANLKRRDYVGLWAMYLIEHIQKGSLNGKPDETVEIIFYKHLQLEYTDMKEMKALYQKWWDRNKYKSPAQLAKEWKNDKRPLSGSFYYWK